MFKKLTKLPFFLPLDPDLDSEAGSNRGLDQQPCLKLCKAGIKDASTKVMRVRFQNIMKISRETYSENHFKFCAWF
jgi:hypothetical protein